MILGSFPKVTLIDYANDKPTRAQSIFHTATSFHFSAARTSERITFEGGYLSPLAPSIANYAIATELYVKSMLQVRGLSMKSHSLNVLFLRLDRGVQSKTRENLTLFKGVSESDFIKAIQEISSAFVDWRYIHELAPGKRIYTSALIDFCVALYRTAADANQWEASHHMRPFLERAPSEYEVAECWGDGRFTRVRVQP
ncbi:MAG TPA: hypothetical protein VGN74_10875 [Brevundimonas sp.]|jgi:hypothetical protein|uniref:hypothetical protein n=1 Tax=Brevundimonas sp. TaxID=1871086 RepID=UPI002E153007|nr:hypothetical protein [Brevundimonas sp.]